MKIVRQMATMLLSLILMFLIMIICILSSIPAFLNPETYYEVLDETKAYELIQESIQNSLDDMLLVNNIELKTLEDFITIDEIKEFVSEDVNSLLSWVTGGSEKVVALDLTEYESRFDERMSTFFRDNHYFLDDNAKADVEIMKENTIQILKGYLRLIDFERVYQNEGLTKATQLIGIINFRFIISSLIIVCLLVIGLIVACAPRTLRDNSKIEQKTPRLQLHKQIEEGLLWSGYGVLAGGLIVFTIFFSGVQSEFYRHTAIQLPYLKECLALLIEHWFTILYVAGLGAVGIGILLMIPYWRSLYKKYMRG